MEYRYQIKIAVIDINISYCYKCQVEGLTYGWSKQFFGQMIFFLNCKYHNAKLYELI